MIDFGLCLRDGCWLRRKELGLDNKEGVKQK